MLQTAAGTIRSNAASGTSGKMHTCHLRCMVENSLHSRMASSSTAECCFSSACIACKLREKHRRCASADLEHRARASAPHAIACIWWQPSFSHAPSTSSPIEAMCCVGSCAVGLESTQEQHRHLSYLGTHRELEGKLGNFPYHDSRIGVSVPTSDMRRILIFLALHVARVAAKPSSFCSNVSTRR